MAGSPGSYNEGLLQLPTAQDSNCTAIRHGGGTELFMILGPSVWRFRARLMHTPHLQCSELVMLRRARFLYEIDVVSS